MRPFLVVLALVLVTSCGDDNASITQPELGSLVITTTTSGSTSAGGYTFRLDSGPEQPIGLNESVTVSDVQPGVHVVELAQYPAECAIDGGASRSVNVAAGSSTTVEFVLTCVPPTGNIEVETSSQGPAPTEYALLLDGTSVGPIGSNTTRTIADVAAGTHAVGLSAVPGNCQIAGENPQTVAVSTGATATIGFAVTCSPPPASTGGLRIITSTTGPSPDPDGYTFSIDGQAPQAIATVAAVIIPSLPVGPHTVTLSGVASNCRIGEDDSQTVNVSAGATVDVSFTVTCSPPSVNVWTRLESGTDFTLASVWGSSAADVYTVGEPGGTFTSTIFHFDGQSWSPVHVQPGATLRGIWASAPNNVFAVGGSPLGDLGYDGVILHYDGTSWSPMAGAGVGTTDGSTEVTYSSVWGTSATDVFAVGDFFSEFENALVVHFDGIRWSKMPLQIETDRVLEDVHGSSPQDVYAVGYIDRGLALRRQKGQKAPAQGAVAIVLRFDGTQWKETVLPDANLFLDAVWSSAPNDVFAVGALNDKAAVYHYDGVAWASMTVPPVGLLVDVWGTSGTDVYAVGEGTILHYDGQSWMEVQVTDQRLLGVWGSSASNVFAVGGNGTILHGTVGTSTGSVDP